MKTLLLLVFAVASAQFVYGQKSLNLGLLSDFDKSDQRNSALSKKLVEQIQKSVGSSFSVLLDDSNSVTSDRDVEEAKNRYQKLAERCDVVLLVGGTSINGALRNGTFPKPTIGLGIFNAEVQQIPYSERGTSGTPNFSYILTSKEIQKELYGFKKLTDFKHITFLFDDQTLGSFDSSLLNEKLRKMQNELNIKVSSFPINASNISGSLESLDSTSDAVYLAIPYEMRDREIQQIIDELNSKKIPTLAMNHSYIALGALATYSFNNGLDQVLKKTAIMIDDLLRGDPLAEMKVNINLKEELYLNINTARKIDFSPSFETLFTANIFGDPLGEQGAKTYSFEEIVTKSIEENLNIKIATLDIALTENDVDFAKSEFLPYANSTSTIGAMDQNRPNPAIGTSQYSIIGSGEVQQLIYSEAAIANIKIQKYLLEAQKYATEQEILTQILNAYNAYFKVLQAKTNLTIQNENLKVFKTNLELSKIRRNVGQKTSADVYRWESEVANATQVVIQANAELLMAKLQLNTLLNNKLDENYDIKDVQLDDELFSTYFNSNLGKNIKSAVDFTELTDFLISEAKSNYPSKRQLLSNLSALDRQRVMNKRLFYLPSVAVSGQLNQNLYRGGVGSEPPLNSEFYNTTWNAGVVLSYPIFDGNRRKINLQRTTIQQQQLNTEIENLDQNLTLQVRSSALDLLTSTTQLKYTRVASENAANNFDLMQKNYQQGTVSITPLIDAQKVALNAKLAYSLSVYNYLVNFLNLENSIGHYSLLSSAEEKAAFNQRFIEFTNK